MEGPSYVVRARADYAVIDIDVVAATISTDYTSGGVTGAECECAPGGGELGRAGDWRTIATAPTDGSAVAIFTSPGGVVYACLHGESPPLPDSGTR